MYDTSRYTACCLLNIQLTLGGGQRKNSKMLPGIHQSYVCNDFLFCISPKDQTQRCSLSALPSQCFPVLWPVHRPNPTCSSFSASWAFKRPISARALSRHTSLSVMVACSFLFSSVSCWTLSFSIFTSSISCCSSVTLASSFLSDVSWQTVRCQRQWSHAMMEWECHCQGYYGKDDQRRRVED